MPPVSAANDGYARAVRTKPTVTVGSKVIESTSTSLKASSRPKEFHIYLGNLDLDTTEEQIKNYAESTSVPIRILSCEIVHSKRFVEERALAAHVVINANDKDKAFQSQSWPADVIMRPWRRPKRYSQWGDDKMVYTERLSRVFRLSY